MDDREQQRKVRHRLAVPPTAASLARRRNACSAAASLWFRDASASALGTIVYPVSPRARRICCVVSSAWYEATNASISTAEAFIPIKC